MSALPRPWVKVCGVTCAEDAIACVSAGVDALGLNFVPSSKRFIDLEAARAIVDAVRGRVELVGVFADAPLEPVEAARRELGLDWVQLHGREPPDYVARLPRSFKAVGISSQADVERALAYPGERVLLDAKVEGALGGTGQRFDWSLVPRDEAAKRLILAGGLNAENVAALLAEVAPFGVDVASGVEQDGRPGRKDPDKVARFVRAARRSP